MATKFLGQIEGVLSASVANDTPADPNNYNRFMKQLAKCVSDLGLKFDVVPPHCFAPIHPYKSCASWTMTDQTGPVNPAIGQASGVVIKTTDML